MAGLGLRAAADSLVRGGVNADKYRALPWALLCPLARSLNVPSAMLRAAERPLTMLLSRHIRRRRLVPLAFRCLQP